MPSKDKQPKKPTIHIHTDEGDVSPYIIHLSREEEPVVREVSPSLDALKESLMTDVELEDGMDQASDLTLDFQDLVEQLRESDYEEIATPIVDEKKHVVQAELPKAAPIKAPVVATPTTVRDAVIDPAVVHTAEAEEEIEEEVYVFDEDERIPLIERMRFSFHFPAFIGPRVRAVGAFVALSFALVLPLHAIQQVNSAKGVEAEITDSGKNAIDNFLRGTAALEGDRFDVASIDFGRATEDFKEAEQSIEELNAALTTLANVIPQTDKTYDSVRGLITAGKELSFAASSLALAAGDLQEKESLTATTKLTLLNSYVEDAIPHVETAVDAIDRVEPTVIPEEYREVVIDLQERAPALAQSMNEFSEFSETLVMMMGGERQMRYLVIFQNNTELRATGGFPGSFAEIDVLNGEIVNMHIPGGGTYDVQGQLSAFVEAPEPLSLINPRWEFHDANWFPDFPTSAKKMLWFYEKAGGPSVDGVLAINATMMPKLLEITGPVEMPEYGRTIDAENFLFETQKIVEFEYEQYADEDNEREEDAPKQFIGDLAPIVLERLTEADMSQTLTMMNLLGEGLSEKDVLLFFENNTLQSKIEKLGWSGSLKQTEGDYLMIVNTNLGGGKTDTVIDQSVDLHSEIQEDGSIINTLTITKEHHGLQTALFEGLNNVDYIRVYVPKGSELISAEGFEIPPSDLFEASELPLEEDEDRLLIESNREIHPASQTDMWDETGKTVFGNWMQTKPGEIETVTFKYRLPISLESSVRDLSFLDIAKNRLGFKDLETHTLFIQKQPGVLHRTTNVTVKFPSSKSVIWESHVGQIEVENTQDNFVRFLIENEVN